MRRLAIAFLYCEDVPRFDRMTFDGDAYHYYRGEVEVLQIKYIDSPLSFYPKTKLGLCLVDAMDDEDPLQKFINTFPQHIVTALAQEVSELAGTLTHYKSEI